LILLLEIGHSDVNLAPLVAIVQNPPFVIHPIAEGSMFTGSADDQDNTNERSASRSLRIPHRSSSYPRSESNTQVNVSVEEGQPGRVANVTSQRGEAQCSKAVVISNDSDLESAIRRAVEAGIDVGVVNPHRTATNRRLKNAATFEIPFRHEVVARCQMPQTVTDEKGRTISRPKAWA